MALTRAMLLEAGRKAFGTIGYADASMDDFTARVGLTRGALYHHFGDKQNLLRAVVEQIDSEMSQRLKALSARAPSRWQGLIDEWIGYIEMALDPEIQRIVFRDAPAVLGDISLWPSASGCIATLKGDLDALKAQEQVIDIDTEAAARLIIGASGQAAMWIANSSNPEDTARRAVASFRTLIEGLRAKAT